jgi:hypothetical protein
VITNDVSDYINLLVRIEHIICNHPVCVLYVCETLSLTEENRFRVPENNEDRVLRRIFGSRRKGDGENLYTY